MAIPSFAAVNIGYTNEKTGMNNAFRYGSGTDQRVAIRFSKEKLAILKGKTISAIRLAVGSRNSTNKEATIFLSNSLEGEPITKQVISTNTTNKFVEWQLDNPYTITGEEENLYVGCMMEISATYGAFSADFSQDTEGIAFAYGANGWASLYGKGYGMPNIQIVVDDADSFTDILMKTCKIDGFMKVGEAFSKTLEIFNFGTTTINSLDAVVKIGEDSKTISFSGLNIEPHTTYQLELSDIVSSTEGTQNVSINLTNVNSTIDADDSDNTSTSAVCFYPADCQKNILVESFTGQTCSNCPNGHSSMETAIAQTGVSVVELCHHSGYNSDIFTMKEDWTITALYGETTYAPAAMLNRTIINNGSTPVFDPQSISTTSDYLNVINGTKPYVKINLDSSYDSESRTVKVKANVYTYEEIPGYDLRYSIWLTQDNIVASQAGGTTDYNHMAVSRGCLTESAWGDAAEFVAGETTEIEKTFELPEVIISTNPRKNDETCHIPVVLEDMKIVFFVNQYSKTDINGCKVFNAAECGISSVDGIANVNNDNIDYSVRKYIDNGRIVITRNGKTFGIDGKRL